MCAAVKSNYNLLFSSKSYFQDISICYKISHLLKSLWFQSSFIEYFVT